MAGALPFLEGHRKLTDAIGCTDSRRRVRVRADKGKLGDVHAGTGLGKAASGQVLPLPAKLLDERAKLCVLPGAVRAESHQATARIEECNRVLNVGNVGAVGKRRIHEDEIKSANVGGRQFQKVAVDNLHLLGNIGCRLGKRSA